MTQNDAIKLLEEYMPNHTISNYKGESFLIVSDGWNAIEKIEQMLKGSVSNDDKDIMDFEDIVELATGIRYNWGFADEYAICDECCDVIRTSPDSYSWMPDYYIGDGYILCEDCIRENPDILVCDYINNPDKANTVLDETTLEELGFTKYEEHDTGMYSSNENIPPKKVYDKLKDTYDVIFNVDSQEQFQTYWSAWIRPLEMGA